MHSLISKIKIFIFILRRECPAFSILAQVLFVSCLLIQEILPINYALLAYIVIILILKLKINQKIFIISLILLVFISFNLQLTNTSEFKSNSDQSYLVKVYNQPRRNKTGEVSLDLMILGKILNTNTGSVYLKQDRGHRIYCKSVEMPWKNISSIARGSKYIIRAKFTALNNLDQKTGFYTFMERKRYSAFCKIQFAARYTEPSSVSELSDYFADKISEELGATDRSAMMRSMILGERDGISTKLEWAFRRTGLMHILVVSGFHIVLFHLITIKIIHFIARYCNWIKCRISLNRFADLLAFLMALCFVAISGFEPSAVRALIALAIYILANLRSQKISFLNTIILAFIMLNLFWSEAILDVGVQLTFAALLAICLTLSYKFKNKFLEFLAINLFANLFTSIIVLYNFQEFSLISFFANIFIATPIVFLVCNMGFVALALYLIGIDSGAFMLKFIHYLLQFFIPVIESFARLDYLVLTYPSLSADLYIVFAIILVAYLLIKKFKFYISYYNIPITMIG